VPAGIEVIFLDSVDSTNDEVRRLADAGAVGPLWVRAFSQTKGRGRRGRSWLSEPGNLFMTGLLTLKVSPLEAANLSFLTALAVGEAIDPFVEPTNVALKWPNDVLIGGKKTSGILLESWAAPGGLHVAIGIGINVVTRPQGVDQEITCVADHALSSNIKCDAQTLFNSVIAHFHQWLDLWQNHGFDPIVGAWLDRAKGLGQPMVARLPHESVEGIFKGIGRDGALELLMADGNLRRITAGDVFFSNA
jgi:BirA family transcriptional regulator, biotin operon repressor / biotin---[acetyl-CoA-carboxylase] ligase